MEFESSNCLISENTHRSTQNSNKYQYRAPQEWEKWKKKNKQKFINFSLRPTEKKKFPQKEVIPATISLGDFSDYFHFYREISRFFTIMELSSFFLFICISCMYSYNTWSDRIRSPVALEFIDHLPSVPFIKVL